MQLKTTKTARWSRLDNAAKIFPANSTLRDPKVFRFSAQLNEAVQPELLQQALDMTLQDFPHYRSVLRRGLFWYFLEDSDIKPVVEEEHLPLCSPLYDPNRRSLLFRTFYFDRRISIEVYHAISDGTGALQFHRTLLCHYLALCHSEVSADGLPTPGYDASHSQKQADSFARYYKQGSQGDSPHSFGRAYKLRGSHLSEYRLRIIEGSMPCAPLLELARARDTTLTVFLGAVLLEAIHESMPMLLQKHPVVLSIPVNLRSYFESQSARNFFGLFYAGHRFGCGNDDFDELIKSLDSCFRRELRQERLATRMNKMAALEHNVFTRAVPLVLKDITLRYFGWRSQQQMTSAFSNLGRITMPQELVPYIDSFIVSSSTDKLQVCLSTFNGRLTVSMTQPFVSTEVPMAFFRKLAAMDVPVTINSNLFDPEEKNAQGGVS